VLESLDGSLALQERTEHGNAGASASTGCARS
jgi:hypothetical protein